MRTLIILAAAAVLGACASGPAQTSRATLKPSHYEIDHERVAMVERQARDRWAQVIWLSLPTKRVDSDESRDY